MNAIRFGSPARCVIIAASVNGETVMNNECDRVVDSSVEHAIDFRFGNGCVVRVDIVLLLLVMTISPG